MFVMAHPGVAEAVMDDGTFVQRDTIGFYKSVLHVIGNGNDIIHPGNIVAGSSGDSEAVNMSDRQYRACQSRGNALKCTVVVVDDRINLSVSNKSQ